jgi:hypothetical protein
MTLRIVKGDITLTKCDATLFTTPADLPERLTAVRQEVLDFRQYLETSVKGWGPGRLYPQVIETDHANPEKRKVTIIHAHTGVEPDYGPIVRCMEKLRDHYPRLGIKSIAMQIPGVGAGLDKATMLRVLKNLFAEPNPGRGIYVEAYEEDMSGFAAADAE